MRIHRSVVVVRAMPVLLLGNAIGLGVIASLDWTGFLSSYAAIPAVMLLILLIPIAMSYVRRHRKPRLEQVTSPPFSACSRAPVAR